MKRSAYSASIITLGCRANQYESNAIAASLEEHGVEIVPAGQMCDLCVINTCTVTAESDRKSRQMIRRAAASSGHVIVTGCFAEIDKDAALSIDGVDLVIGNKNKSAVVDAALALLDGKRGNSFPSPEHFESCDAVSAVRFDRARTYIKIEDGCDNRCAYCIIPIARGPVRSKSRDLVLREAKAVADAGVREIILTGIEIARYGKDLSNGYSLIDLIEDICDTDKIARVSMGSVDPSLLTPEFIDRISRQEKFVKHFHISLQSGCSAILASMRRKYNAEQALETAERLKSAIPGVMISTDIIAGFPGETEANFNETIEFLRKITPLHIHSFPYSKRAGTEAATMPGQLSEQTKKERNRALCELNGEINSAILAKYVESHGETPIKVLCEKIEDGEATGHSEHFVEVHFPCAGIKVGEFADVVLKSAHSAKSPYVIGEIVKIPKLRRDV